MMNERIDQLLVKAGAVFGGEGVVYDTFDPKKFAELIVKECMRMCDCADVSYLEHGCDKEASGAAGARQFIKEWFEVE
jgi:hypothetical protein